jgi:hypothetical protein
MHVALSADEHRLSSNLRARREPVRLGLAARDLPSRPRLLGIARVVLASAQAVGRKLWKSYAAARRRVLLILSFILRRPRCRERMPAPSMPLVMMP